MSRREGLPHLETERSAREILAESIGTGRGVPAYEYDNVNDNDCRKQSGPPRGGVVLAKPLEVSNSQPVGRQRGRFVSGHKSGRLDCERHASGNGADRIGRRWEGGFELLIGFARAGGRGPSQSAPIQSRCSFTYSASDDATLDAADDDSSARTDCAIGIGSLSRRSLFISSA